MKILITGICGFVGSVIAKNLAETLQNVEIYGIDNFSRPGSWLNKSALEAIGVTVFHGDIRIMSDIDALPRVDWVIDAAANPSVMAGVDGKTSSHQLIQNNLIGTIHLLEYCKRNSSGFILLSTSRVYSMGSLSTLKMGIKDDAYYPISDQVFPDGITLHGVNEKYSTSPPVSLYGSSKFTSEHLALEYGSTFNFPVWINRCGVLAGAGQFGHPTQGIFAFWIHSFREKRPLKYIGFKGQGHQVRDCLHPKDLIPVLTAQMKEPFLTQKPRIVNFSGGIENSMSLRQLTLWCTDNIGENVVDSSELERPYDIPWMVLDNTVAKATWDWVPRLSIKEVLEEISDFSRDQPSWIAVSRA